MRRLVRSSGTPARVFLAAALCQDGGTIICQRQNWAAVMVANVIGYVFPQRGHNARLRVLLRRLLLSSLGHRGQFAWSRWVGGWQITVKI